VQLGGGIRDLDTIERCLDDGLSYVIIGTAAVKNPGFLHDACGAFPGHIIVGLDAREGKVAVDGWSKMTGHDVIDLAKKFEDYGVEAVIYTDIGRDGMMTGVNIEATVKLAQSLRIPVIASGGIASMKDVKALCKPFRARASSAPSPGAPSTKARWISRRRRPRPTSRKKASPPPERPAHARQAHHSLPRCQRRPRGQGRQFRRVARRR
jgi:hypothetical protein